MKNPQDGWLKVHFQSLKFQWHDGVTPIWANVINLYHPISPWVSPLFLGNKKNMNFHQMGNPIDTLQGGTPQL